MFFLYTYNSWYILLSNLLRKVNKVYIYYVTILPILGVFTKVYDKKDSIFK